MYTVLVIVLICTGSIPSCHGIYIPWGSDAAKDDVFSIPLMNLNRVNRPLNMKIPPTGYYIKGTLPYYRNMSNHYSLDDRCSNGMALSAMWHHYSPYAETGSATRKGQMLPDILVKGMFPRFLTTIMRHCCNNNSRVDYGMFLRTVREAENYIENSEYDFSFPINVFDSKSTKFKDRPFIALVTAPRVILLVKDQPDKTSRTDVMVNTILDAWPMMVFIFVTASLSGIIVWFLDHTSNPDEFPPNFFVGCWEGFWWAFVTMTTVGYGDISPKSKLARVFCVMWIFLGLSVISIYTGIVTAALSASTSEHFNIHGSIIGAVNGSEEYKLGVSMNAEMKAFSKILSITQALLRGEVDGALVDSYIINYFGHFIKKDPVRVERSIEHKITYGFVLPENSTKTETCFRRYIRNHPNEMFEILASFLKPLKNPTDEINQEFRAAEKLFYNEEIFNNVVIGGGVAITIILLAGFAYDFFSNRAKMKKYKAEMSSSEYIAMKEQSKKGPLSRKQLKSMVQEYQHFHSEWMRKFEIVSDRQRGEETGQDGEHETGNGNNVATAFHEMPTINDHE